MPQVNDRIEWPTFLRYYVEAAGRYTVPPVFHAWSALSILATFASRNVYYEHIRGNPLRPNLYVFLIAKSAAGKGLAITNALRVVSDSLVHRGRSFGTALPYLFEGRTSPQALVSRLAWLGRKLKGDDVDFFFVTPELAQSLDLPAAMIGGFIRMMTGIYDATGREWNDNTRTHGAQRVPPAYLNWLSGTTPDWLRASVGELDFKGGFAGRIVPVYVDERMPFEYKPRVNPDADEIVAYLRSHLQAIRCRGGAFTMTPDALELDESFARNRHDNPPGDERLHPFYDRGATLARKLSMLFSLARGFDLRIESNDMRNAQIAVLQVEQDLPTILDLVSETKETRGLELMRSTIERARRIPRRTLAAFIRRQVGITHTTIQEFENTLLAEQAIVIDRRTDEYVWIPKNVLRMARERLREEAEE